MKTPCFFLCKQKHYLSFLRMLLVTRICNQRLFTKSNRLKSIHRCLVTMKIDSPEFKNVITEEVKILENLFVTNGFEIRIAGGAVRDLLLGIQPKDLDFATTATPTEMKEMFTKHDIRMINATGEKHGTITPRINNKENFEVTTLRIDVVTYGRAAEVQFVKDWQLDANRRDLTINSMFLGLDGTVFDYFNGYEDLKKRRVVFVGDADTRIREDYLRILRYFRFYGRIAEVADNHDPATLEALKNNCQGLERISGERIWSELHKTVEGNFGPDLLKLMIKLNLGQYIGLPEKPNFNEFDKLIERSKDYIKKLKSITILASMLDNVDEMNVFRNRCKLSNVDRDIGLFIIHHRHDDFTDQTIKPYQLLVMHSPCKLSDARIQAEQLLLYRGELDKLKEFQEWTPPRFPVNGFMITNKCQASGKEIGFIMAKLKNLWEDSDFQLSSEELLEHIPTIKQESVKKAETKKQRIK